MNYFYDRTDKLIPLKQLTSEKLKGDLKGAVNVFKKLT